MIKEFRIKSKIRCELFQYGLDKKTGDVILYCWSRDEKNMEQDMIDNPKAFCKIDQEIGYRAIRKNGKLNRLLDKILKEHDNFRVIEEPDMKDYIITDNGLKGDTGAYEREYAYVNEVFYVRVKCDKDFMIDEMLVEVPLEDFYEVTKDGR